MYNYSFIIPHKNCPELLKRCLNSIPERDDIQIIVVDDNSDDGKKPLLLERKGLEIVLLDASQSKGAGRARNIGLEHAKGEWLLFADSDDLFTDGLSSVLDKYMGDRKTDIVYLNADNINENGERWPYHSQYYIYNYLNHKFYSEKVLRYGMWTPWTRMVSKRLIEVNRIRFEEVPVGNDMMFSLNCSKTAVNIAAEQEVVYLYFVPQNRSLTESFKRKPSNIKNRMELMMRQNELYHQVHYCFRDTTIMNYRNPPAGSNALEYKQEYKKQMKQHHLRFSSDIFRYILFKFGISLGIVRK